MTTHDFPWITPKRDYKLIQTSERTDPAFHRAALEIAEEESKRTGRSVSVTTVKMTLALRNEHPYRAQLRKRYTELKKEIKLNESTQDRTNTNPTK